MTDTDTRSLEDRYEDGVPTVKPMDNPAFDPHTDEWANYWDLNPVEHGGKFVRFYDDHWVIVEVTPPSALPRDFGEDGLDTYLVDVLWVYDDEVWIDPEDPLTHVTGTMRDILDSLNDGHHLPNAPPFLGNIDYYVADMTHYISDGDHTTFSIEEGDVDAYWEALERFGVEADEVGGVSDRDLPDWVTEADDETDETGA